MSRLLRSVSQIIQPNVPFRGGDITNGVNLATGNGLPSRDVNLPNQPHLNIDLFLCVLFCQIKTNIFFSFRFLCVRALKATISLSQRVATERKKKIDTRPLTIGREERGREKKTYRWRTAANPESSDLHLLPSMSCFSRSRTASAVLHSTATSRHVDVMLLITLRETGNDQN